MIKNRRPSDTRGSVPSEFRQGRDAGFTLIELLVVVLIIGILASVAVPSYLKTVETTKADDAVSLVNMIGTTNKMFALDHSNSYIVGTFPTGTNASCGTGTCPATGPGGGTACELVWCKYLADQNFGSKPYYFYACNGTGACGSSGGSNAVSGAKRKTGTYVNWGYSMSPAGVITNHNGAPDPTY